MANLSRLTLILIIVLLLAGTVYAATSSVVLYSADSVTVSCAGQHYAVAKSVSGKVVVSCRPVPVYPEDPIYSYFPVVTGGS